MDDITVIVDETIQDITVEVVTTGITTDQANQIIVNKNNADASKAVTDFITVTQAVNLDTVESDTTTNNAKISFDSTSSTRLLNTSGTNTGDQDLSVKVDKVTGYSLTKNDLTDILKTAYDNTVTWITTNGTNLINHLTNTTNPHSVTKTQVGLGNVQNTDLTSAVNLNTAKVGITPAQASDITTNNAKITYPSVDSTKVGFVSVTQAVNLDTIESDTATNNAKITYPSIDSTKVGFISVTQAVNLDTIESDTATNNAKVSDINHVTIELPNVDNTSDINKPVSTATQSALDLKVDITDATITTTNIFKSVSFTMDFSDRVIADSGTIESRECVMNEYLKILN
jgi:hypothetical protein